MKKMRIFSMIDPDVMSSVFGNNPDAIHQYVERFVTITSVLLTKIEESIQKKDSHLAMKQFHQLKGPVGSIGFKAMYRHCEKAEEKIGQLDWEAATDCVRGVEKELNKLNKETQRYFFLRR